MDNISNPAGLWIRFIASILDSLIVGAVIGLLGMLVYSEGVNLILNLLSALYSILLPVFWHGYTVGKRIFGIRIIKVNGENVGIGTMLMRTLVGGIIYAITLGIGLIVSAFMIGLRKDKRGIHDFIAGTYVTYDKP